MSSIPSSLEVQNFTEQTARLAVSAWRVQWFSEDKNVSLEVVQEGDLWILRVIVHIEGQKFPLDLTAANTSGHSVYLAVKVIRSAFIEGGKAGYRAHKVRLHQFIDNL